MSFATRLREGVERYQPSLHADLRKFQARAFGPDARQTDPARFEWLFRANPCLRDDGIPLWACRKEGAIVGQQAGIPFELNVGGRALRASWAIDLMIDAAWRLRGVGPALSEMLLAEGDVTVGLDVSEAAQRAFRRAGWIDLGTLSRLVRPLRGAALPSPAGRWASLFVKSGFAVLAVADRAVFAVARANGVSCEVVDRFDERIDALWRDLRAARPVQAARSLKSLRWRFDDGPAAHQYRRYCVLRRGRVLGFFVLRFEARRGGTTAILVDYLCAPRTMGMLLPACVVEARRGGAVKILYEGLDERGRTWFRFFGFIPSGQGPRMMLWIGQAARSEAALLSDPRNWFVTRADSDLDHPIPGR